jgi:hypothetical protein
MKPRKKWEPVYRFGGNPASFSKPAPLGATSPYTTKTKSSKRRKK